MTRRIVLRAPAKLNLHLGVHSQLDWRGYHKADSLMIALDLADEVAVEECAAAADVEDVHPVVVCKPPVDVPPHKNTVFRAAVALGERVGCVPSVRIELHKCVPDQAGMGGSSADAAAVLRALCELWDVDPADERVVLAAQSVGADVPFFLDPVPTLLVGAGDVVQCKFCHLSTPLSIALVRPKGPGVSTPTAYAAFDKNPTPPANPDALCEVLRDGLARPEDVASCLANNLDPVACELLPQVARVKAWLLAQDGVLGGQVTGSGSCVFAVCSDDDVAERVVRRAREQLDVWSCVAHAR